MIAEIGIIVGLFILVRVIPGDRTRIVIPLRWITIFATVLVILDLGLRGTGQPSLATRTASWLEKAKASMSEPAGTQESAVTRAPSDSPITILRGDGGSITTLLGYGIKVAGNSSLRREWITINDASLPVRFDGLTGVSTIYVSERYSGAYQYRAKFKLVTKEPISAIQVRYLIFDVWGDHVRTLSLEEVADFQAGPTSEFSGSWRLHSENDVEKHYASIAYIARVRLKNGRVITADSTPALEEARKFSKKFTAADLDPPKKEPEKGAK